MTPSDAFHIVVNPGDSGQRLDVFIASRIAGLSRSRSASLILAEYIRVNGGSKKPGYRICIRDQINGIIPEPEPVAISPESMELDIIHEDRDLIVVNKPPGLVIHPAPGHRRGTLVNALLYHCPDIGPIGGELRPGIVHRLDKDTSGVLVVAKNAAAHAHLSAQFSGRTIRKTYLALVLGQMAGDTGKIELPIGRHPVDRKRMSTNSRRARAAETRWRVRDRFNGITYLELNLKTGRTHQARVHCSALQHAIVGDPVYGGCKPTKNMPKAVRDLIKTVHRQMLHAWRLECIHPSGQTPVCFEVPLPEDMADLISRLRLLDS